MISTDTLNDEPARPLVNSTAGAPVEIEVLLSGVTFGPFTAAKVHERLAENLLALTDSARFAFSDEWRPLKDILDEMPTEPVPEPPEVSREEPKPEPMGETAAEQAQIDEAESETAAEARQKRSEPELEEAVAPEVAAIPEVSVLEDDPLTEAATPAPTAPVSVRTPTKILPPQVPGISSTLAKSRPLESRFKAQSSTGTGPLPAPPRQTSTLAGAALRSGSGTLRPPAAVPAKSIGGIRSQILARTSNQLPTISGPTSPRPGRSMTAPLTLKTPFRSPAPAKPASTPLTSETEISTAPAPASVAAVLPETPAAPEPIETPAAAESLPEPVVLPVPGASLIKSPQTATPPFRLPGRFPTTRPKLDDEGSEAMDKSPEQPVSPPPMSREDEEVAPSPAAVNAPAEERTEESESAVTSSPPKLAPPEIPPIPALPPAIPVPLDLPPIEPEPVSPATRAISVAELASGTLPLPPAKPVEKRPPASIDSILTVRLPARRTQVIKTLPGAAVVKAPESKPMVVPAQPSAAEPPPRSYSSLSPSLPVPAKNLGTGPTEPIPSAPRPATNPIRRGMANASALAATTILNPAEKKPVSLPAAAESAKSPLTISPPPPSTIQFQPTPESADMKEPARPFTATPLVETRRAALKQARKRRKRQGIAVAIVSLVFVLMICAGIYYYFTANREVEKPLPAAKPTPAPADQPSTTPPPDKSTGIDPVQVPPVAEVAQAPIPTIAPPAATNQGVTNVVPTPLAPPPAPTDPKVLAHITTGQADQAKGDLDGAIGEFTQALILDPKYVQGYGYRASANQAKGDIPSAIADTNQLITLDPTNANGFCQRGFLKQASKDSDGALADYSHAIELDPKSYVALYNRGMIQEQKGQPDAAIADYNQVLELNPRLAGAFYNRGNAKMDKGDLDGAIADYTNALEINPKIALASCNRGLAEQNQGNLDGAMSDYNQAITLNPNIAVAYYNRGLIEEQKNNLDACIDDSTKALVLAPDTAQAYYNRGVALQAKGNLDAAANDLRKFGDLSPKNTYADYARLYLWVITNMQNRKAQADQELSTSLDSSWNAEPAQLPSKIAAFLLDRATEADLLAVASSPDSKKDQSQHCEVLYFDGIKKMLTGDKSAAIDAFHQCLNTGQANFCEYILAQAQLHTLSAS